MGVGVYSVKPRVRGFLDSISDIDAPESVKQFLKHQKFHEVAIKYLEQLEGKIRQLTSRLRETTQLVKTQIRSKTNYYIRVRGRRCNKGCLICLNRFPLHYPELYRVPNWHRLGIFPPAKKEYLNKEKEIALFSFCGISPDKINEFYRTKEMRHDLIKLYHYTVLCLSHFGLLPEAFKWGLIGERVEKKVEPRRVLTPLPSPCLFPVDLEKLSEEIALTIKPEKKMLTIMLRAILGTKRTKMLEKVQEAVKSGRCKLKLEGDHLFLVTETERTCIAW